MGSVAYPFTVVVDTREKKPYDFGPGVDVVRKKLDTGDYSIEGFEDIFAVERKSLDDLIKSITWERDRFKREIDRAEELAEFAVIIESSKQRVYAGKYYSKVHPNAVMGTVNAWDNATSADFHWTGSRDGGKQKTLDLLSDWYIRHGSTLY